MRTKVIKGVILLGVALGIVAIVMSLILSQILAIIGTERSEEKVQKENQEITLKGIPISVVLTAFNSEANITIVIKREDGGYVLCNAAQAWGEAWFYKDLTDGEAVVQSEIDDGDEEPVSLIGKYKEDKFEFKSVSANGFTVGVKSIR